jgi:hypothetical protein
MSAQVIGLLQPAPTAPLAARLDGLLSGPSLTARRRHPAPPPELVPPADEPEPMVWRTSARGNPWTLIGDLHIVVFPDRGDDTQWLVRVQRGERRGRYIKHVWPSAEAAQEAIERALRDGTAKFPVAPLSKLS